MKISLKVLLSAMLVVLASCSMPQLKIVTPYEVKERISLGFQKVVIYQVADSVNSLAQQRYVPMYRFDLLNEKGEVLQQYVGAMQEFLSRVAGPMRPEQKILIRALPSQHGRIDSLVSTTTWSFPNYEGEVSDINANSNVIRTRYWSVDSVGSDVSVEVFATHAVSTPYEGAKLNIKRSAEDIRVIRREAEEYVYYELKSFVLTRFRNL